MFNVIAIIVLGFTLAFVTIHFAVRISEAYEAAKKGEPQDLFDEVKK